MVAPLDTALGMLLGISAFLLALSLASYRRSGVRTLELVSVGLSAHLSLTVAILVLAYATDWLDSIDGLVLIVLDAAVLAAVLLIGLMGGRLRARPS